MFSLTNEENLSWESYTSLWANSRPTLIKESRKDQKKKLYI